MQRISGSKNKETCGVCRRIGTLLHGNAFKTKKYNLKLNHNINIITARAYFFGRVSVLSLTQLTRGFKQLTAIVLTRGRINSVGRALDCRAGGRGFDSRGRTNAHGLKITAK